MSKEKKPFYKKVWFWVVIAILVLGGIGAGGSGSSGDSDVKDEQQNQDVAYDDQQDQSVVYMLVGGETGEYGKVVTLNKDTDMPVDKYLYKLPAGEYRVTTDNENMAAFSVVKDEITTEEGNTEYPEILDYVTEGQILLTAGDNDFNGKAKKETTVTIAEDESISIPVDGVVLYFEVQ